MHKVLLIYIYLLNILFERRLKGCLILPITYMFDRLIRPAQSLESERMVELCWIIKSNKKLCCFYEIDEVFYKLMTREII